MTPVAKTEVPNHDSFRADRHAIVCAMQTEITVVMLQYEKKNDQFK